MTQLKALLDRIHAVNQEIKTVTIPSGTMDLNCQRYFPRLETIDALPMICPLPPAGTHDNEVFGSDALHSVWQVELRLAVDNFFTGSDPSSAQSNAEACIDHLLTEYWNRPRLELVTATQTQSDGAYAPILIDARLRQNTQVESVDDSIAMVRFTLIVETIDDIERI